jgi:hypothetical protein
MSAVAVTVYVTVGCALFGDWWYQFLWDGEFNWHQIAFGLKALLDDHFPLLIGMVLAACVAFTLGSVFKARLFRFVDRFAGHILFASLVVVFTNAVTRMARCSSCPRPLSGPEEPKSHGRAVPEVVPLSDQGFFPSCERIS